MAGEENKSKNTGGSPSPLTSAPGVIGTGAATGAAVGAYGGPLGAAIGAAVGATLGALGVMKGKTPHLDYSNSVIIARTFAEKVNAPIITLFGYNSEAYHAYGAALAGQAWRKLNANLNTTSKSWQTWIQNALNDFANRNKDPKSDPGSVIYIYAVYVGLNYDASRPEEYGAILTNNLTLMFQELVKSFPQTQAIVYGVQQTALGVVPPKVENKSVLERALGTSGGSTPAQSSAPSSAASLGGTSPEGQKVIIAGFLVLIIGFLIFTRKKK